MNRRPGGLSVLGCLLPLGALLRTTHSHWPIFKNFSREADAAVFLAFAAVLSIAAEDRGLFRFAVCVACAGLVRFVVSFGA